MAVLNKTNIIDRMRESDYQRKLVVTPLLSENQIGPASIDIRLGSSIIIPRKTHVEKWDVTEREIIRETERRLYDRIRLKYHSRFILHPNQLILGVTFEYVSLPPDVCCLIMTRSSWGRLGLIVAAASMVQPGFKGSLTLELINESESPIALYPGLPVGQLVFVEVVAKGAYDSYKGRYACPTEAEFPKFYSHPSDDEVVFWGNPNIRG